MNYNVKEQHFYPSKLINNNQFNKLNTQENEQKINLFRTKKRDKSGA